MFKHLVFLFSRFIILFSFSYFQNFITLLFFVVINVSTNMSDSDTVNNVADTTPDIEISLQELRNERIRRFAQRLIRYRQSIGEQVLNNRALANSELADASNANSESNTQYLIMGMKKQTNFCKMYIMVSCQVKTQIMKAIHVIVNLEK